MILMAEFCFGFEIFEMCEMENRIKYYSLTNGGLRLLISALGLLFVGYPKIFNLPNF